MQYSYDRDLDINDDENQHFPAPGVMRIWTKNSTETRTPRAVSKFFSGDYIKPDVLIPLTSLPPLKNGKLILYVESVGISEFPGSFLIQVKITQR